IIYFVEIALGNFIAILLLPCVVGFQDVAAPVFVSGVPAHMSDRHHAFQHESGYGLIAGDANDFLQVSAKGMRHGLQKTAIASIGCIVGIGIGPNEIAFQLQVEIADTQRVDVFCAQLQRPLVRPPAGALANVLEKKFIQHKLSVDRKFPDGIHFEVQPQQHVIAAAVLLFNCPEKDDRVEITQFEIACADGVVGRKDDGLEKSNINLRTNVHAEVVEGRELVRVSQEITAAAVCRAGCLRLYLAQGEYVVKLPYLDGAFQKKGRRWKV